MYSIKDIEEVPYHPVMALPHNSVPLLDWGSIAAGFPSPAADHAVDRIDLMAQLITHPQATFLMRARGNSMIGVGIFDKDVVVINRALQPATGLIVVAVVDNEFTVKTLELRGNKMRLKAANPICPDIIPREGQEVQIWGVVTSCIKQFRTH